MAQSIPDEVAKPAHPIDPEESPREIEIVVSPPTYDHRTVSALETSLRNTTKLYEDETLRSKLYKKKIEELQKEMGPLKERKNQGGVPRAFDSETEVDYMRLVKKCMAVIDDYELEIISLKKHMKELEAEAAHNRKPKLISEKTETDEDFGSRHRTEGEHLNKTQLELSEEVHRLSKKVQALERQNEEITEKSIKQLQMKQSKLSELRQHIRERQQMATEPFLKQIDKLSRQIENHKLKQQQNEQLIKELTQGHLKETKKLTGKSLQNIAKQIGVIFQQGEKQLQDKPPVSVTKVRGLLRSIQTNIDIYLNKSEP